jgi:hypothetical protein
MLKLSTSPRPPSNLCTGEKLYFGAFLAVLFTSGIPMLCSASIYNAKMNGIGKRLGDSKVYDVDSMPWRLRHKLIQDVLAMGTGIVAAWLGSRGTGPMLVTITAFDVLGSATSAIVAVRTKLRAEWIPAAIHGIMGVWGLRLCWNQYACK